MGACASANLRMPKEKRFRRAIKLYEVGEVRSMTNLLNRNKCFSESGDLPLTLAAKEGHEAVVAALISGGADVNRLDRNGRCPLHIAVQHNDEETVDILLDSKANPNKYDDSNFTPLHIAAERGYKKMVRRLLNAGSDANECEIGVAPLVLAVNNGHADCVELLLERRALPNVHDARGNSPLHIAVSNSDLPCVQALLKHGADPLFPCRDPQSLLALASIQGHTGVLQAILSRKGFSLEQDDDDIPSLIAASAKGHHECVELLLSHGANIDQLDKRGHDALYNCTMSVVDYDKELFYCKYFSNVYRVYSKYDALDIYPESSTKCAMSLVQGGANVSKVWERFTQVFPQPQGVTFEQMVLCEVLIQACGFQDIPQSKLRNFSANLLSIGEYGLVKLLFSAGVSPNSEDLYLLSVRGDENDRAMFKWVKRLKCRPRTLRDVCRRCIRKQLSWNVLYLVEHLDLSEDLREYICIMDTEHYSQVDDS